jgi:hypothetical protein
VIGGLIFSTHPFFFIPAFCSGGGILFDFRTLLFLASLCFVCDLCYFGYFDFGFDFGSAVMVLVCCSHSL